jgi:hypothetical protein
MFLRIVLAAGMPLVALATARAAPTGPARVTDGDTIVISGQRICLCYPLAFEKNRTQNTTKMHPTGSTTTFDPEGREEMQCQSYRKFFNLGSQRG